MKRAFLSSPSIGSVKDKREGNNMMMLMKGDRQHSSGATADYYTWPRSDYTCSYCKRQFGSAQALGGHMNVHRRERARLRLLPPLKLAEGPNPSSGSNPNHNFSSMSSHSAKFFPYPYGGTTSQQYSPSLPSLSSLPYYQENKSTARSPFLNLLTPRFEDLGKKKCLRVLADKVGEVKKEKGWGNKLDFTNKGNEVAGLDFEIGSKDSKEALDLELRLGYL